MRFELLEPSSIEAACTILQNNHDARPIAGGTALITLIKQQILAPKILVNLRKIPGTSSIVYDPVAGLRVGALTSIYDLEHSATIRQNYPALAEACRVVANIRIRNMATIGGNLAHGDYQSDPPTALLALDANVELAKRSGSRELKLSDFLKGVYETALEPGELLVAVKIPPPPRGARASYIKFTTRSSEDRPCAGIAALARVSEKTLLELRLVVGAVSMKPVRFYDIEEKVQGLPITGRLIDDVSLQAAQGLEPIDDLNGSADYKRHLVRVLVRRSLVACTQLEGRAS